MKAAILKLWLPATLLMLGWTAAGAQNAPGEDPVVLNSQVSYEFIPLDNAPKSRGLDPDGNVRPGHQARIARHTANSFAANNDAVITEEDFTTTVKTNGLRKTCIQEVVAPSAANASRSNKYGPKPDEQVVVVRGDLVNICK